jgi:DNA recombination protein RmuC
MDVVTVALVVVLALVVVALVVVLVRTPSSNRVSDSAIAQFQEISRQALESNNAVFLQLAEERLKRESELASKDLGEKKKLIDQQLESVRTELARVEKAVAQVDAGLTTKLEAFGKQTLALTSTTDSLRRVLGDSRARGQWGERMAEDVLRTIGFVEGINYHKQVTLDVPGSRPDFVFPLPGGLTLNMDVKFPFDNYKRFVEADAEPEREVHQKAFLRDVRARIKEVATREYIDPEGGTVNYALLFVPNESVYAFICENDAAVFDDSLAQGVVCCSPYMLFAMLALVDQAAKTLNLQKASEDLLGLYGAFSGQWGKFTEALGTLGDRLRRTQNTYDEVMGVRMRALQRPLDKIETLRERRGIAITTLEDADSDEMLAIEAVEDELGGDEPESARQ